MFPEVLFFNGILEYNGGIMKTKMIFAILVKEIRVWISLEQRNNCRRVDTSAI